MDKKQAKEALAKLLKKYNFDSSAIWDCHGTPVLLHKACEQIAIVEGIQFERPAIIENSTKDGVVAVMVEGVFGDKHEWSFGEVSPKNNKNAYPYSMAEKRAKDRVVLKLIGMSGYLYSEDEMDDFKESNPARKGADQAPAPARKSAAQAKRDGDNDTVRDILQSADTAEELDARWQQVENDWLPILPLSWEDSIRDTYENHRDTLKEKETA